MVDKQPGSFQILVSPRIIQETLLQEVPKPIKNTDISQTLASGQNPHRRNMFRCFRHEAKDFSEITAA